MLEFLAIKVIPVPTEGSPALPTKGDNYHLYALPEVDSSTQAVTYSFWYYKGGQWKQLSYKAATA